MELIISGLKCDTPHCNYRDDSVKFEDYPKHINSKCPICQSNLLTEQEYITCLRYYKSVEIMNKLENIFKWLNPMHYYRLMFGDTREDVTVNFKTPKRKG